MTILKFNLFSSFELANLAGEDFCMAEGEATHSLPAGKSVLALDSCSPSK